MYLNIFEKVLTLNWLNEKVHPFLVDTVFFSAAEMHKPYFACGSWLFYTTLQNGNWVLSRYLFQFTKAAYWLQTKQKILKGHEQNLFK